MKKWSKSVILFMLTVGFVLSISAPITYAGYCTPFHADWFYPNDEADPDFFVHSNEYANLFVADLRNNGCHFWMVFRKDYVIFAEAILKDSDGNKHKEMIRLTKEQWSIWTSYVQLIYKIRVDRLKGDGKIFLKISENSWEYVYPKPFIAYPAPDCEITDLISGKILRDESDGYFISNHFLVTKIK